MGEERGRLEVGYILVPVVVVIAVAAFGGAGGASSTGATILEESPGECSPLTGGERQSFRFSVEYDLGNEAPGKVNVMVKEEPYGEPTTVVDISDRSARDTVEIDVEEYIDPNWESVTVKATVYAADERVASGSDEIYYPVSGSGWACDSTPERIGGRIVDGDGGEPPAGWVVIERASDGERAYREYRTDDDCPGCFSFEDQAFVDAGGYTVHVYGSDGGYPPYWGYADVTLDEGDTEFVSFERGGVYSTDLRVADGAGSTAELRFGPGEPVETHLDVQKPRHGRDLEVEVYLREPGEDRASVPDEVYDPTRLAEGPNSYAFTFDAPPTEGTYEVEYLLVTDFDDRGELITDVVEGPTIAVEAYEPPRIESRSPAAETVDISAAEAIDFSVEVADPDTAAAELSVSWTVDGERVAGGTTFSFDASAHEGGEHRVGVHVSDGRDRTEDAEAGWTVEVIELPTIDDIDPGNTQITAGEELTLRADASDPGGFAPLSYEWTIGDRRFEGPEVSHTFAGVGSHEVTLRVENARGVATERSVTVAVRNDDPDLVRRSPADRDVDVTAGKTLQFTVDVADADESPVSLRLLVDGRPVDEETVRARSERTTLAYTFEEPGTARAEIVAEDGHGAVAKSFWDVAVASRPPRFEEWSPEPSTLTGVMSGGSVSFSAAAADPDGEDVTYEWYVDGDFVDDGREFARRFEARGEYDVTVLARDPSGGEAERSWTVQVAAFREAPSVTSHFTGQPEFEDGSAEFFTVSFQNPRVNDRAANVEILVEVPEGVTVRNAQNVESGDRSQFRVSNLVAPDEQESIAVDLNVNDERMVGETVEVDYRVMYYPEGNKDDHVVVSNESTEVRLGVEATPTGVAGPADGEPAPDATGRVPGFTFGAAVVSIAITLALAGWARRPS